MSHLYDTDVDPETALDAKDAIADTSLSAFEKLRLSEEAIAAKPPRANLPYVRALVKCLGQIAVAEADDQVRKIDAMLSSRPHGS